MISIIIPSAGDRKNLYGTISYLQANADKKFIKEIIVVENNSANRLQPATHYNGVIFLYYNAKRRSALLNYGAKCASGKIFYFLQPDALPPQNYTHDIIKAVQKGFAFGTFTLRFDYGHWLLNILTMLSRISTRHIHLKEQSLFVTKELFEKSGGFHEDHLMLEDYELIKRLNRYSDFIVLPENVVASAKKFTRHGIAWTEGIYTLLYCLYRFGLPQRRITQVYDYFFKRKNQGERSAVSVTLKEELQSRLEAHQSNL